MFFYHRRPLLIEKNWLQHFHEFFLQNRKKTETEKNAFCVINFESIEVQTHSALQNDRLNLSFVKDIDVDGRKVARNGRKTAI